MCSTTITTNNKKFEELKTVMISKYQYAVTIKHLMYIVCTVQEFSPESKITVSFALCA